MSTMSSTNTFFHFINSARHTADVESLTEWRHFQTHDTLRRCIPHPLALISCSLGFSDCMGAPVFYK